MSTSLYLGAEVSSRLLLPTVPVAGPVPPLASRSLPGPSREANSGNNKPWRILRTIYDDPKPTIIEESAESKPDVRPWGSQTRLTFRRFQVQDDHPELASATGHMEWKVQLPARELTWHSEWDVHSDKTNFYYLFKRELRENDKLIRERTWQETIARDHQ